MIARFAKQQRPGYVEHRWFVSTACDECLAEVSADVDPDWPAVSVSLLSHHMQWYSNTLRGRLRHAWHILRGRHWADVMFYNKQDVDDFIEAVTDARNLVFSGSEEDDIQDLGHGVKATPVPEYVREAIAEALERGKTDRLTLVPMRPRVVGPYEQDRSAAVDAQGNAITGP